MFVIRNGILALMLAKELGRDRLAAQLAAALAPMTEPRRFGEAESEFGWYFHLGEEWPRGQLNSLMVTADLIAEGSWEQAFQPHGTTDRFEEPTVVGVDFPTLGIAQAYNDPGRGVLVVETYCGDRARYGQPTTFRVANIDAPSVTVVRDGTAFGGWTQDPASGDITILSDLASHIFEISTGVAAKL